MTSLLSQFEAWNVSSPWLTLIGVTLATVVLLWVCWSRYRSDAFRRPRQIEFDTVNWAELNNQAPPTDGPLLEAYHVPVRLALLVVAPAGRQAQLPSADRMESLVEQIIPGLSDVVRQHQPKFSRWPQQLSSEGFVKSFFAHVDLPGNHGGKGTHWCAAAGRFEANGQTYLAGLVCRAIRENSLGEFTIEHPGKWLDVFRIRTP